MAGFEHGVVYLVRIEDTGTDGRATVWFAGPYGDTRAGLVASELQIDAEEAPNLLTRRCTVEALYSREDCLLVGGYTRETERSHI